MCLDANSSEHSPRTIQFSTTWLSRHSGHRQCTGVSFKLSAATKRHFRWIILALSNVCGSSTNMSCKSCKKKYDAICLLLFYAITTVVQLHQLYLAMQLLAWDYYTFLLPIPSTDSPCHRPLSDMRTSLMLLSGCSSKQHLRPLCWEGWRIVAERTYHDLIVLLH